MALASVCGSIYSQRKSGRATFYADKFHGRRTSNGETYHRDSFTCANNAYPFGTILKVSDKHSGKTVYVKVNDRIGHGTNLDLSFAAAKKLGIVHRGTTTVDMIPVGSVAGLGNGMYQHLLANGNEEDMNECRNATSVLEHMEALKSQLFASVDKEKNVAADWAKKNTLALLKQPNQLPQAPAKRSIMEATVHLDAMMAQASGMGSSEKTVDAK